MRNFTIGLILFFVTVVTAHGQTRRVNGTLTDPQSGTPMPGVNIVIKGTNTGTVTDANGYYEIEAPIGSVLVFSFVGYTTREIEVLPLGPEDIKGESQKVFRHKIPDSAEKTLSPYFFIKSDDPSVDEMPLKSTKATVNIAGVIADVQIQQVYINTGKTTLEAVYIFPGSTRAAVYGMSMTVGNRKLTAKIKEKERARTDYEQAKREGKTATLLEQQRPNVFQMNVANILPGDTIAVDLQYTELLVPVDGNYQFVYPTVVGPRYSETPDDETHQNEQWAKNPYLEEGKKTETTFAMRAVLNSGIPIKKVTSTTHVINVQFENKGRAVVNLGETETNGGNRDFVLQYRLRGGNVESGLLLHPRQDENFFLLMMEPPTAPTLEEIPPREYIFIVDVSGSMHGFPIAVSKRLLKKLINGLRPTDLFNVMLFESSNQMLNEVSVPATQRNVDYALAVLDKQNGSGGTRLYPALQTAMDHPKIDNFSRTFVVITDGYVTIEKEAFNMVRDNLNNANLFAIGIGSSVNRYLIEGLAHAGMGEPFFVLNESEAEAVGKQFTDLVEHPVLTNIQIDFGKMDVYDVEPLKVPDIFTKRPIIVFGKYRGQPTGTIKLTGTTGTREYVQKLSIDDASTEHNEALRYLWARNKIKYLDDYAGVYEDNYTMHKAESPERNKEVTRLGLKYNLLTRFTSFIAIDSVVRNTNSIQQIKQPLPLPQGVSNKALGMSGPVLEADIASLSEVVVVAYGVQQKANLCYTVTSVSSSEIPNGQIPAVLQGRVAGVQINQNSEISGANTSVRIRGSSSMVLNNSPLYVIDGVPMDGTDPINTTAGAETPDRLAGYATEDIESIQVLKSTSATAIYGSRGANGVILITTKKPRIGRREISFTSSFALEKVNKLPDVQHDFAQGSPQGGVVSWRGADQNESFSWGPAMTSLNFDGSDYAFDSNGRLTTEPGNGNSANAYSNRFFRTGFTSEQSLRVSRKTDKTSYNFSIGYTSRQSVAPVSGSKGITSRLMLEHKFNEHLKIGSQIGFSQIKYDLVQKGNSASSVMYGLLTTPSSFNNDEGYMMSDGLQRSYNGGLTDNPWFSAKRNPTELTVKRILPSIFTQISIARWLKVEAKVGSDLYRDDQVSGHDVHAAAYPSGMFTDRTETFKSINGEVIATATKTVFNSNLEVNASLGMTYYFSQRDISQQYGFDLTEAGKFQESNSAILLHDQRNYFLNNNGFLSRINLDYKNFLIVEGSYTQENTSTLPNNNRLHSGSGGVAFNFTGMPYVDTQGTILSNGKIKGSWGSIEKEAPMFMDPNYALAKSSIENTWLNAERLNVTFGDLKPERLNFVEIGTELEFWDNRLALEGSLFRNRTSDAYVPVLVNHTTASLINGGSITNKGFEASMQFDLRSYGEVNWRLKTTFTKYTSHVDRLPQGVDRIALSGFDEASSSLIEGQPYGVIFGTRYLRNENGEKVIGADGFPVVDPAKGVVGDPNPEWIMGITNTFNYKGISLEFLFDFKYGGDVWNGTKNTMNYFGTSALTASQRGKQDYVFEGVTEAGDVNTVAVDFAPATDVYENRWVRYGRAGVTEDAIEDASWIRLRDLSLTYRFTEDFVSRLGIRKMAVSFVANNLILITPYSGIDPETNLTGNSNGRGLDYFNMPNTKSYGLTLKLGL
jgi:Ca-activated chloride channel family protein